ncbi:thymidylate kinase [Parasphingorhabdus marina DSM 22363]|uniref:Thymidylate kinase n=1 Tax=Parasphingorhabdus marina DSM 22363 TaxID=1123272 RepID=A0A1N6FPQ7_9SPHN|nr:dTMP kinase [Parasphingorhabdus marina]SIN97279.1 thymidylate kinase [Parasphingorhabdus marina DSM 22363]
MTAPGRFISLEGGEGTGKSTQARAVGQALESRGLTVHLTREPGGTPGAETIRELLLTGHDEKWNMRTEALLFAAARAEHCDSLIRPALEKGEWVISDRFLDSSRAYQSVSGELTDADILAIHDVGSRGLLPDRTFVLDIPEEVASRRAHARDRGESDRIGGRDSGYHRQVMEKFRQYAADEPGRVRLIEASGLPEDVTASILEDLSDLLG